MADVTNETLEGKMRYLVGVFVVAMMAMMSGCGGSSQAPSPQPLNLTGTWEGRLGQAGSMASLRVTWVATQTGNVVSGIATMVRPAFNVQARGVMTGILDGDRLTITYAVPPDSIPGFATCEIAGIGIGTAAANAISGTLPLMFRSCAGTGLESPSSNELTLTK